MKKLFNKVKSDYKFRNTGEGHKLTDDTRTVHSNEQPKAVPVRNQPTTAGQMKAAVAAIERYNQNIAGPSCSKKVKMYPKEKPSPDMLPEEAKQISLKKEELIVDETPIQSLEGIRFISVLTGEIILKSELQSHYQENLILKLGSDPVKASCDMIHTLNEDHQAIEIAIKTLCRYIDNLLSEPNNEKFKRIRKGNKAFMERVAVIKGSEEFLNALGFKLTSIQIDDEKEELFFAINETVDLEKIKEAKNCLTTTEPLKSNLCRNMKVYRPSDNAMHFNLPNEFYQLTMDDIKKEQKLRTETVEQSRQLQTKAMRQRRTQGKRYNYTLLRIRFPGGIILQGTFATKETLVDVKKFVCEHINTEWAPYTLKMATGQAIEEETKTLEKLNLVPAVVINLIWDTEVYEQLLQQGIKLSLSEEALSKIMTLT